MKIMMKRLFIRRAIIMSLICFFIFTSCKTGVKNEYRQEKLFEVRLDTVIRQNKDTLLISEIIYKSYTEYCYIDLNGDTILMSRYDKNECVSSEGKNISLVSFDLDQNNKTLVAEIFLIPPVKESFFYEIDLRIINYDDMDTSLFESININKESIAGYKFNFERNSNYGWYMDLYVKNSCSNKIYHSTDSFDFNFETGSVSE